MGTNYYAVPDPCKCCGRSDDQMHIGKSSAGWCFTLHVIPEKGINTLDDWKKILSKPGIVIRNEYNEQVPYKVMLEVITARKWGNRDNSIKSMYGSWEEFHALNHSQDGPDGLLRHRISQFCIGHGEGTWDYVVGEFS